MATQNAINNLLATTALSGTLAIGLFGANIITYAKLQQAGTVSLLGNPTGITANVSEVTLASSLSFTGTTLQVATAGVTYAKIQNVAATSLLGNSTGSPASPQEITLGAGLSWSGTTIVSAWAPPTMVVVAGTTQSAAINTVYVTNNASLCTVTLPATAAVGSIVGVRCLLGSFAIAQNASQLVHVGNVVTTTGVGGSITSGALGDVVNMECVVANTTWIASVAQGNVTVV